MSLKTVCVYCGSSNRVDGIYKSAAHAVGTALGTHGLDIVYGGGHVGLMGILADSTLQAGGKVTGVIPQHICDHEVQHLGLTELVVVDSMHDRKQIMADRADAFVILPGGFGTMDEMFEILTWKQLGLHNKPVIIYNVNHFWDPLLALIENMIDKCFAPQENRLYFQVATNLDELFQELALPPPPPCSVEKKWE